MLPTLRYYHEEVTSPLVQPDPVADPEEPEDPETPARRYQDWRHLPYRVRTPRVMGERRSARGG